MNNDHSLYWNFGCFVLSVLYTLFDVTIVSLERFFFPPSISMQRDLTVVLPKPRRRLSISQDVISALVNNMHYLSMVPAILRCSKFSLGSEIGCFPLYYPLRRRSDFYIMAMSDISLLSLSFRSAILLLLYSICKYVYRLTLHPLSKFPGPKWAAVSNLYGGYFDLVTDQSYVEKIRKLHEQYGPIVRAWPNQLHIYDMDAFNQIFKIGTKFDKDLSFYTNPALPGTLLNIPDTKSAMARKSMYSPAFSKEAIRRAETSIHSTLSKFLNILQEAAQETKVVDLSMGFRCLTADTSMNFIYQDPLGVLDSPNFQAPFIRAMEEFGRNSQYVFYFPKVFGTIARFMEMMPTRFVEKFMEPLALTQWCVSVCRKRIVDLQTRSGSGHPPTMFDAALNPDTEKGHFTPSTTELTSDAFLMLLAGTDTTAASLTVAVFGVLSNPHFMNKLRAELRGAMPTVTATADWASLEKLPYLSKRGVVKESFRMSYGAPGRLPRVVPSTGAIFCGQSIPPGTVVSCSNYLFNNNPAVFTDPFTFSPERWLATDVTELEKNMTSFSRGSRSCPGMNLAYAELYLVVAHLFRLFDMELFETSEWDMEWKDFFTTVFRGHLKVKVGVAKD
ncbi:cytochrome P450 [Usnea florida]